MFRQAQHEGGAACSLTLSFLILSLSKDEGMFRQAQHEVFAVAWRFILDVFILSLSQDEGGVRWSCPALEVAGRAVAVAAHRHRL